MAMPKSTKGLPFRPGKPGYETPSRPSIFTIFCPHFCVDVSGPGI